MKAITYGQIRQRIDEVKETNTHEYMERLYNEEWVRLEEHQQEIEQMCKKRIWKKRR